MKINLDKLANCLNHRQAKSYQDDWSIAWDAEYAMKRLGILTHGIEYASFDENGDTIAYVNLGDTYDETIIVEDGKVSVSSWGEWLEKKENSYSLSSGKTKCANCGEWVLGDECDCGHYTDGQRIPNTDEILHGCELLEDIDSQKCWIQTESIDTGKPTYLVVRVEYCEYWDKEWAENGKYHISLNAVSPNRVGKKALASVLETYGMTTDEWQELSTYGKCQLLVDSGTRATLWQEQGKRLADLLSAAEQERQKANILLGFMLDRAQNAIGSTGWHFMAGDILGGLKGKRQ